MLVRSSYLSSQDDISCCWGLETSKSAVPVDRRNPLTLIIQVAMFEAHSDLEIFRIRLGKALDYEFHEDYIGGYFSEKGPRDVSGELGVRLS